MSTPKNPGAFPCAFDMWKKTNQAGMTLRDYFAAAALPQCQADFRTAMEQGELHGGEYLKGVARAAYETADAMLTERNKGITP